MVKCTHILIALPLVHGCMLALLSYLTPETPAHLTSHPIHVLPDLLSTKHAAELRELLRTLGEVGLDTNLADTKATLPLHEHVGEAEPISADGTCDHKYLLPSIDGTQCILAQRVDIGMAYMQTGGAMGLKDTYEVAISRLQSFGKYIFDLKHYPTVQELFATPAFLQVAANTCPPSKQVLDPFQFNLIVQVPGQTVATHIDGVYFLGADRFDMPQWLLAAMHFSNLWSDLFVDQVQIVGYFHEWQPEDHPTSMGDFIYWPNGTQGSSVSAPPTPRSANAVDGTKIIHAGNVYYPAAKPPKLDKMKQNRLVYDKDKEGSDKKWSIRADGDILQEYAESELRSTIVFRARCFSDSSAMARFKEKRPSDTIDLSTVLETLRLDMISKSGPNIPKDAPRLDLALAIIGHYINYPPPDMSQTMIPFNYCMIGKLFPITKTLLNAVCTHY
jgi:hypothetical protein